MRLRLLALVILASAQNMQVKAAGCGEDQVSEVQFILDSSDAVTLQEFVEVRKCYGAVINALDVGPGSVRVGVVRTATNANMMIDAAETRTKNDLIDKFNKITYTSGYRYLGHGFQMLYKSAYKEKGRRVVVVATNSVPSQPSLAIKYSRRLRAAKSAEIFVIGIGNQTNKPAIYRYASEPFYYHFFHIASFSKLLNVMDALTTKVCDILECGSGHQRVDGKCKDIDECRESTACFGDAICENDVGTYYCKCSRNYKYERLTGCELYKDCYDKSDRCPGLMTYFNHKCTDANNMLKLCPASCAVCDVRCPKYKIPSPDGLTCVLFDECKELPMACPSGTTCVDMKKGYKCICGEGFYLLKGACIKVDKNFCVGYGDPHFLTFDKAQITFQGTCSYTMAEVCSEYKSPNLTDFNVVIKNENRNRNTKVSYIKHVTIRLGKFIVQLAKQRNVLINGEPSTLPAAPSDGISVGLSGEDVLLRTDFGLTVTFDGDSVVKVEVPDEYRSKMCGVCGNCDGNSDNDKVTKYGMLTYSGADIGNSWKVVSNTGECASAEEPVDKCDPNKRTSIVGENKCGILTRKDGPFSACFSKVDPGPAFESCVYDMCYFNSDDNTLCRAMEGYADECREEGVELNWRSVVTQCKYDCHDKNAMFGSCISACPRTCADVRQTTDVLCHDACVEGCQCKTGFVLSDKVCVKETNCGCLFEGSYYLPDEIWGDEICGVRHQCDKNGFVKSTNRTCDTGKTCETRRGVRGCYCERGFYESDNGECKRTGQMDDVMQRPPVHFPSKPLLSLPVVPEDDGDLYFSSKKYEILVPRPHPLGMESGIIKDAAITASSEMTRGEAAKARPLSGSGWVPLLMDKSRWIMVDLEETRDIHGVGTLGHSHLKYWVVGYEIHISIDNSTWQVLKENNTDVTKIWEGNSQNNRWRRHCLHKYYGHPIRGRFVRIVVKEYHIWIGLRFELYGYRNGNDPSLIEASIKDAWTLKVTGCECYFSTGDKDCACCEPGGCQCPNSNRHQCVQCGYATNCGTLDIKPRSVQLDPWTKSEAGCPCPWDNQDDSCACCQNNGCQCGQGNRNQCVQCGRPQQCGAKEHIFGPNLYCKPRTCP